MPTHRCVLLPCPLSRVSTPLLRAGTFRQRCWDVALSLLAMLLPLNLRDSVSLLYLA